MSDNWLLAGLIAASTAGILVLFVVLAVVAHFGEMD
jgi:hypothetical protein